MPLPEISNLIADRVRSSAARREVNGWDLPVTTAADVALALKWVNRRTAPSLPRTLEALTQIGREGRWLGEEHLRVISSRSGAALKVLRTSIQRLNAWLADLPAFVATIGVAGEGGVRAGRTLWTPGPSTAVVLAGDATALAPPP